MDLPKLLTTININPMTFPNLSRLLTFLICTISVTYGQAQCENDTIAPIGNIVNFSSVLLDSDTYEAEIYAVDFFFPTTSDNCTTSDSIRYTFTDTSPVNDPAFIEEYNSSSVIITCVDANNSPIIFTVYAWDLAGNYLSGQVPLTIVTSNGISCPDCENDTIPPVLTTHPEIIWLFGDSTSIEIWASDFVASAYDLCSPNDSIQYTFSNIPLEQDPTSNVLTLDCYDLANSPLSVDIYAWDTDGNYTIKSETLLLQADPNHECLNNEFHEITGNVDLTNDDSIAGISINLENEQGDILYTTYTNDFGYYSVLADEDAMYLSVEYAGGKAPDISFLDLVFMQRHLLGLYPFDNYQLLASDINGDNRMKVNDLKLMRQMVLGILDKDEYLDPSWRFVVKNQDEEIDLGNYSNRILISENPNPIFIGYRMGDVN